MTTLIKLLPALLCIVLLSNCQTFVRSNGKKHRLLFTVKDRSDLSANDTSAFVVQDFALEDYLEKKPMLGNKRKVVLIEGADIKTLAKAKGHRYVYFSNPGCPVTRLEIRKLDSLATKGLNIMVVSLRADYSQVDKLLNKTSFSNYPYYVVDPKKYGNVLLMRQAQVIKDACAACYTKYKDDLSEANYLSIENGIITPEMADYSLNMLHH